MHVCVCMCVCVCVCVCVCALSESGSRETCHSVMVVAHKIYKPSLYYQDNQSGQHM